MSPQPTDILDVIDREERERSLRDAVEAQLDEQLVELMQLKTFRRFVSRLLDDTGCNAASFDITYPDPSVTAFREGRRDIGRVLQARLYELCPDLYSELLRERADEIRRRKESMQ